MTVNRRTFLKTATASGGAFLVGVYVPVRPAVAAAQAPAVFEPNVWVRISPDNSVRIMLSQLELGQGVMTSMPMLVAEDLDVDWTQIKTEWAPADRRYGNPGMGGAQTTVASMSVRGMWKPLREAGATARAMLLSAAAQTWGVPVTALTTNKGVVIHTASGRRATYGSLAVTAASLPVPKDVALKPPSEFKFLGQSPTRLDLPDKVNGRAVFGIDIRLPGMLTARVLRIPTFGGKVASFDATRAKAVPGVRHVVQVSTGVAVIADNYWAATKGVQALDVKWDEGPLATLSSADIRKRYADLVQRPGKVGHNHGDMDAALETARRSGGKVIERVYEAPFLAHASMEPMNCTADVRTDGCDVYVSTQSQTSTQQAAMAVTGLRADQVKVHTLYVGGGFGRRGEADFVTEAVEASQAAKAPVKVVWTREDDMQHDYYRPISYARMWGAVDATGAPTVFAQRLVQQSLLKRVGGGQLPPNGVDPISLDGAMELPYAIPNVRIEYIEADPGIPYGFWRSVGVSFQSLAVEGFVDELAGLAGKDPYQFRRDLLSTAPRHRACLDLAAEKGGWSTPAPQGRGRGIAVMESFGSIIAAVAEVSVADEAVRVHRVVCAVDAGWVIHPDTIKAQMEGGMIYGISAALTGEITIEKGRVVQRHFVDYPVLRYNQAPEVEVHIVPSTADPGGIGEPSTGLAAGVIANAIFAATGRRVHTLPVRPPQRRNQTA